VKYLFFRVTRKMIVTNCPDFNTAFERHNARKLRVHLSHELCREGYLLVGSCHLVRYSTMFGVKVAQSSSQISCDGR
jgi:hypothetical protein